MDDPIYIIKTTKAHEKEDVWKILYDILGSESIDRLLSIDGVESDLRVLVVLFWRVPSVNLFHGTISQPTHYLLGKEIPWTIEPLDPYPIFKNGNFPAPHFLRNSKNLNDNELEVLGIGGPAEFVYINLPKVDGTETHWEMYRSGKYYMPDMSYYNKPHMEPLTAVDKPSFTCDTPVDEPPDEWPAVFEDLKRWRDFYLEYPKSWPKDLNEDERIRLEARVARLHNDVPVSPWTPESGRDPTNFAENQIRELDSERLHNQSPSRHLTDHGSWDYQDNLPQSALTFNDEYTPSHDIFRSVEYTTPPPMSRQVSSFPTRAITGENPNFILPPLSRDLVGLDYRSFD